MHQRLERLMQTEGNPGRKPFLLTAGQLDDLLAAVRSEGYVTVGPAVEDGAIGYREIASAAELPRGYTDEQEAGHYRLRASAQGYFAYTAGAQSWKRFLHPPRQVLWQVSGDGTPRFVAAAEAQVKYALIGVRACELAAIEAQDKVLMGGAYDDPYYRQVRTNALVVVVQCTRAGGTCFCESMGTGPVARKGYDLALTEFAGAGEFLVEVGSARGAAVMAKLRCATAPADKLRQAEAAYAQAAEQMGRQLERDGLREVLAHSYTSGQWEKTARRCLACGNCTMVCPTCFCTTVEDKVDLSGERAEHAQVWDSCFDGDFSYIHGGAVRKSTSSRYRQWMLHKLYTWEKQFGMPGCVGCGRCITWCPVGIDITAQAQSLRHAP